jgi:hypothetical protein
MMLLVGAATRRRGQLANGGSGDVRPYNGKITAGHQPDFRLLPLPANLYVYTFTLVPLY